MASSEGHKAELAKIDRETERLIDAIVGGVPASKVKDRMTELDARKTELEKLLESAPQPPPVRRRPCFGSANIGGTMRKHRPPNSRRARSIQSEHPISRLSVPLEGQVASDLDNSVSDTAEADTTPKAREHRAVSPEFIRDPGVPGEVMALLCYRATFCRRS